MGTGLAVGQIAAEDGESGAGKGFGEGDEQRGAAVGSGAVGEDQAASGAGGGGRVRVVEEAVDRIGCEGGDGRRLHFPMLQ